MTLAYRLSACACKAYNSLATPNLYIKRDYLLDFLILGGLDHADISKTS